MKDFFEKDNTESFASMKEEALVRMEMIRINPEVLFLYKIKQQICCSDKGNITEVPDNIMKEIEEWQNEYGNLVYHVIHSNYIYETYECLSVSCYKEDWEYERELIEDKWVMSHSINITEPSFTESGSIGIQNINGTLLRLA